MSNRERNIDKYIRSRSRGSLLFPDDFGEFGTPEAVHKALQRLREKGVIK
jgi:hypothetical protein